MHGGGNSPAAVPRLYEQIIKIRSYRCERTVYIIKLHCKPLGGNVDNFRKSGFTVEKSCGLSTKSCPHLCAE